MQLTRCLFHLLQFEAFQETIRGYLYKASESKLVIVVYVVGSIVVLTIIYRFLARKK